MHPAAAYAHAVAQPRLCEHTPVCCRAPGAHAAASPSCGKHHDRVLALQRNRFIWPKESRRERGPNPREASAKSERTRAHAVAYLHAHTVAQPCISALALAFPGARVRIMQQRRHRVEKHHDRVLQRRFGRTNLVANAARGLREE